MLQLGNHKANTRKARTVVSIAAALLGTAVLCQPDLAHARGGGGHGGGFHGGGFHGDFHGGFHAGGFHASGFHGRVAAFHHGFGGVHGGRWYNAANGHRWYHGWHGGHYGWWSVGPGLAWTYYTYPWWGYDYSQPYASQTWYYCSDPAGYYPYVGQCNTGWQTVPAS
jgi:hypothetical protein